MVAGLGKDKRNRRLVEVGTDAMSTNAMSTAETHSDGMQTVS